MRARFILALLAIPIATSVRGQAPLPPELAAVPGDALGFVHIRVADIWKSDALKELRQTVMQAGDKALTGFDKRFLPTPSSIDQLTVVALARDPQLKNPPVVFAMLSVNKPFDHDQFLKSAMPDAVEKKTTNGSYWVSAKSQTAVSFVKDRLIVFGMIPAVEQFIEKRTAGAGPLTAAIQAANSDKHITAALNLTLLPAEAHNEAPPPVQPLLKAKTAVLTFDVKEHPQIDLSLNFADDNAAAAGMTAVNDLAKMGRDFVKKAHEEMLKMAIGDGKTASLEDLPMAAMALVSLGGLERADAFLAAPPIKREGNALKLSVSPDLSYAGMAPVYIGLLLPAVQKVRSAASRISSTNNLKQIGLAMHNYHDVNGTLPPAAICDKNGKPLLSWRVAILPYIEQNSLYQQFKLDEPWDSEHNKKLIPMMPKTYMNPEMAHTDPGMTNYCVIYGADAAIGLKKSLTLMGITDGTSDTGMVFETAETVSWTKPGDFAYDKKKPLPKFFNGDAGFSVLFCDGSVHLLPKTTPEKTMRLIIEANDGQVLELPQ